MNYEEIELMRAGHEFEIIRIKAQMLADVTTKIMDKYDFITFSDIEEISNKARIIVFSVFSEQCKEKGGVE